MQVKHKDYSGSYSAIYASNAFGIAVVCVGILVALISVGGIIAAHRYSGGMNMFVLIGAAFPGAGIVVTGIFILVFSKMAEASVHTAEMTQQLLQIAIRSGDDNTSEPSPRQGNRTTTYGRSATEKAKASLPDAAPVSTDPAPTLTKAKEPAKPKPLRPLGGDKPDQADGDVVETHRDVKIYKRETGIFIGSQWYPGVDAAKQAIDQHAKGKKKT